MIEKLLLWLAAAAASPQAMLCVRMDSPDLAQKLQRAAERLPEPAVTGLEVQFTRKHVMLFGLWLLVLVTAIVIITK